MTKDTFRVNITISNSLNDWFDTRSKETGITKSALMAMALSEYIDQKESIKSLGKVDFFINQLEDVKNYIDAKVGGKEK